MVTKSMVRKAERWWRDSWIDPEVPIIKAHSGKEIKPMATKQAESTNTKSYKTTRMEVLKTVMIAVLVTAIIAFVAGMQFANKHNAEVSAAANTSSTATVATKK